ncbi:hypothetical protein GUJ93_ZPchr0458g22763 [Zizania palustris]|uniref:Uncharacterized protein n=1 Tax=Zizania palustris TaxID=103762 RepID=A0A8J5RLH4_ZIZPA|nr:hypothetical protein GUJ93_ZPchr0458g22763 [Zizania palustris]
MVGLGRGAGAQPCSAARHRQPRRGVEAGATGLGPAAGGEGGARAVGRRRAAAAPTSTTRGRRAEARRRRTDARDEGTEGGSDAVALAQRGGGRRQRAPYGARAQLLAFRLRKKEEGKTKQWRPSQQHSTTARGGERVEGEAARRRSVAALGFLRVERE